MAVECLLLTRDPELLKGIRASLDGHNVDLQVRADAASAAEIFLRRHLDGFIIDCASVPDGNNAVRQIRNSRSNRFSVVLLIGEPADAINLGADFAIAKPKDEAGLRAILDVVLPRMQREHRRCSRHPVNLPVDIASEAGTVLARLMNVSEGGMAVTTLGNRIPEGIVTVKFELPSTQDCVFVAKAEVVWADKFATGLHLIYVDPPCRAPYEGWLQALEAQSELRSPRALHSVRS